MAIPTQDLREYALYGSRQEDILKHEIYFYQIAERVLAAFVILALVIYAGIIVWAAGVFGVGVVLIFLLRAFEE